MKPGNEKYGHVWTPEQRAHMSRLNKERAKEHVCQKCSKVMVSNLGTFKNHARWCGVDRKELFWSKVKKGTGCWTFTGAHIPDGYGWVNFMGKSMSAHRFVWILTHGSIPKGMHVLHRCDNRPCVRPDHLFLGTHTDNMRDMQSKGRAWRGGSTPKATPL